MYLRKLVCIGFYTFNIIIVITLNKFCYEYFIQEINIFNICVTGGLSNPFLRKFTFVILDYAF